MTNEETIWNYLIEKINNPYGVAGLMGNLFAESSLNPLAANRTKKLGLTEEQYTLIADQRKNNNFITDGIAYGLAQWCYKTRKQGLYDLAKGKSVGDLIVQLEYLWIELQKYKTVLNVLHEAKSIREASDIVLLKYEKPKNTSETIKEKRAIYGQKYFDKYAAFKFSLEKRIADSILKELEKTING